jgi:glucose/arabinose dehydrogenase/PKD repeat protein
MRAPRFALGFLRARAAIRFGAGLVLALAAPLALAQWPQHFEVLTVGPALNYVEGLVFAPDGTALLLEKPGQVRVMRDGVLQTTPLADLRDEVNNDWDRGLLGVALTPLFQPDGSEQSWIYLLYTVSPVPGADNGYNQNQKYSFSRLTRYRVVTQGTDWVIDSASRHVLLGNQLADGSVPDCIASLHNSHSNGTVWFGSDGTLLLATGDGAHYDLTDTGGFDDPGFDNWVHPVTGKLGPTPAVQDSGSFRSQDVRSLAGKVLRIDPSTGLGLASNPFYDGDPTSHASRVWALGLRNPFRGTPIPGTGALDPAAGDPGLAIVGDVGWNTWEELDFVRRGDNFGWPCREGFLVQSGYSAFHPTAPSFPICSDAPAGTLRNPMLAWHHGNAGLLTPGGLHFDADGQPQGGFSGNCAIAGAVPGPGAYPPAYAGRLFFGDYGRKFIRTLAFDTQSGLASAVYDFGVTTAGVVDLETHPLTGEIWYIELNGQIARVKRLHYGINKTPVALATATPSYGALPLHVVCDASASFDSDLDALTYQWDFGDGSPPANAQSVQHTYANAGAYTLGLTVTDALGASASWSTTIHAGNSPPQIAIASPLQGLLFNAPQTIALAGSAVDPEDGPLALTWSVDLLHGAHLHPGVFTSSDAQPSFTIDSHGEPGESYAYRVRLEATDSQGLSASASAWMLPAANVVDPTGTMQPISRVEELYPPTALGAGNKDLEVIRDLSYSAVGANWNDQQFDSAHGGAQGDDDWIGLASYAALDPESAFVGIEFQEGKHFADGGWFESLWVEVRDNGVWTPVSNLRIAPDYPFSLAQQSGFDGVNYQTYELWFDPQHGDAVRVRGKPGGAQGFIGCGELRARLLSALPPPGKHHDITSSASIVAHVFELTPPHPTGNGARDPNTIRNGTIPQQGSTSALAQYDTQHTPKWTGEDWIGYTWTTPRLLSRLEFTEGLTFASGGGWDSLRIETRDAQGVWTTLAGAVAQPSLPPAGPHYEQTAFEFPPLFAFGIRLAGDPHGVNNYVSVAELRAFEVQQPASCSAASYASASGAGALQLAAIGATGVGLPVGVEASGALGAGAGVLAFGVAPAMFPLFGGSVLVDPAGWLLLPLAFDANGAARAFGQFTSEPQLAGTKLYFQAVRFGSAFPDSLEFSNGLELSVCDW